MDGKVSSRRYINDVCYVADTDEGMCLIPTGGGKREKLTHQNYQLLSFFLDHPNQVHPTLRLMDVLYPDQDTDEAADGKRSTVNSDPSVLIDSAVSRLRARLTSAVPGLGTEILLSVKGIGYRFNNNSLPVKQISGTRLLELETVYPDKSGGFSPLYTYPDHFVAPTGTLNTLYKTAFQESNFHVIWGPRGMGKSVLSIHYADMCATATNVPQNLRYRSVLFTTYQESLNHTICVLQETRRSEISHSFDDKIDLLASMPKPSLLIVDNYSNESDFLRELSPENETFQALSSTGCHVLITSHINLEGCPNLRQTVIQPLPLEDLKKLFSTVSGYSPQVMAAQDAQISSLLADTLSSNTYLTILTASLARKWPVNTIAKQLSQVKEKVVSQSIRLGRYHQTPENASLMAHLYALMDMAALRSTPDKYRIMTNLMLMPLRGVPYSRFFRWAFPEEEEERMASVLDSLIDTYWCFLDRTEGEEEPRIRIHPMVRKLMADSLHSSGSTAEISYMVQSLNRLNRQESFIPEMPLLVEAAVSTFEITEYMEMDNLASTFLVANISSNYDTMRYGGEAYRLGQVAIERLCRAAPETPEEQYLTAYFCNVTGYSVLHNNKDLLPAILAEKALSRALQLIQPLLGTDPGEFRPETLNMKIHGNMGALWQRRKDYDKALQYHMETRKCREALLRQHPSPNARKLIAASDRSIGTDYYYLADVHPEQYRTYMEKSLACHRANVDFWAELGEKGIYDFSVGMNRLLGAWLALCRRGFREDPKADKARLTSQILETTRYFAGIHPIPAELSNCLKHTLSLYSWVRTDFPEEEEALLPMLQQVYDWLSPIRIQEEPDFLEEWREDLAQLRQAVSGDSHT